MQITSSIIDKPVNVVQKKVMLQIEVDADFLDMLNGIGNTNGFDRVRAGMSQCQSNACVLIYTEIAQALRESGLYKLDDKMEYFATEQSKS